MQTPIFQAKDDESSDSVETALKGISQNIIVVAFGLLPLLFIPVTFFPFDYAKILFVIIASALAIIFFSLSVLRSGKVSITAPIALWAFWGIAAIVSFSAVLSGDVFDAFVGQVFEVHTALFVIVLALIATVTSLLGHTKMAIMRFYILLTASAAILAVFHVSRLMFGGDFLSLGMFTSTVSSPIGGWNDLALFFGLSILLSLVALEQLPLTKWGKIIFSIGVALSLVMLAVINFFAVWVVLALVSLVILMYTLTKDRFSEKTLTLGKKQEVSLQSILLSASVFAVSLVFIIGGPGVGGFVADLTDVSYVEVRPSFEATIDIARGVYGQNAFLGIGPNKFVDAWRLYKDPSINQTIFWATDFRGGAGYIPTQFITSGIFGIITWVTFLGLFLLTGFRMLFGTTHVDRFWYFIGSSSFIAASYLWGMSFVYVPGATILLLAAMFTSITFTAYAALVGSRGFSLSMLRNKRTGIILIGFVMLTIVASASALYYVGRHYSAMYTYGTAITSVAPGTPIAEIEQEIVKAHELFKNDVFARQIASYQLGKMNSLLALEEPDEQQRAEFQAAVQNGVNAAQLATALDPTDSLNWEVLGGVYSILAGADVEGAQERAQEAFVKAQMYNPNNPAYVLLEAQLLSRTGDFEGARALAQRAIQLKPNYTDGLFFLTQLDIAVGNADAAVATTKAIISLEPNNPARYYQLGVLELSLERYELAVAAFGQAVQRDASYANARYFMAIAYAQLNNFEKALEQLAVVLELNPGNEQVLSLMSQLETGTFSTTTTVPSDEQVQEPEVVTTNDDSVTTTEAPDTSLIAPINTIADTPVQDEPVVENVDDVTPSDEG